MQPEDQNEAFQAPQETSYFSQTSSPVDTSPGSEVAPTPDVPPISPEDPEMDAEEPEVDEAVTWEAPEYPQRDKGPLWFVGLAIAMIGLIALDIFVIKSFLFSFSLLIIVMAIALVVHSYRPAALIHYVLSEQGLYINETLHGFAEFKGFGVVHDGMEFSIELIPVRRFRPGLTVYFTEDQGEAIVDVLGARLPMQTIKPDFFDKIIHSLGL